MNYNDPVISEIFGKRNIHGQVEMNTNLQTVAILTIYSAYL